MSAFAFLSVRLFSIFLIVEGFLDLAQIALMWPMVGLDGGWLANSLALLLPLIPPLAGLIMWFLARPISRIVLPPGSMANEEIKLGADDWTRLVFVMFGLYLVVTSIPSLAAVVTRGFEQSNAMPGVSIKDMIVGDSSSLYQLAFTSVRLMLGVLLIIGRSGIVRFAVFLKTFGLGGKGPPNQSVQPDQPPADR